MERLEGNRVRARRSIGLGDGQIDELGLSAVAVRCDDRPSGDPRGDRGAVVAADDVQAQVQAGCDPCAGEDLALVDVQLVCLHCDFRIFRRE